jgi:hypothetical protein
MNRAAPQRVRVVAAALAAGAMLVPTAAPAAAWPLPLTSEDTNYLNAVRGNFPGDDDQLLLAISAHPSAMAPKAPSPRVADAFSTRVWTSAVPLSGPANGRANLTDCDCAQGRRNINRSACFSGEGYESY